MGFPHPALCSEGPLSLQMLPMLPLSNKAGRRLGSHGITEAVGPSWLSPALGSLQHLQMISGISSVGNSPRGPCEWPAPSCPSCRVPSVQPGQWCFMEHFPGQSHQELSSSVGREAVAAQRGAHPAWEPRAPWAWALLPVGHFWKPLVGEPVQVPGNP